MRRQFLVLFAAVIFFPAHVTLADTKEDARRNSFVTKLLARMTIDEKIGQLTQYTADMAVTGPSVRDDYKSEIKKGRVGSIFNAYTPKFTRELQQIAVENTRLKIPLLFGYDVIHGHRTIFPIPLGESSSWDLDLIQKSARLAAAEAAADGVHWAFAPMVDVGRDARWGRVAEGAGEDPWLGSRIAEARVRGLQGIDLSSPSSVLACVKHFAAYGAPSGGRDYGAVNLSQRELFEIHLPPFEAAVRAGAMTVMTAFNDVSGVPSTANKWLIDDVLRSAWGFRGFVVSDYTSVNELVPHGVAKDEREAGLLAFKAGVDMDMQGSVYATHLKTLITKKQISMAELDQAVRRVLEMKYRLGLFADPYRGVSEERAKMVLMSKEHMDAARDIARRSIVLLKNSDNVLPLKKSGVIALVGPMADNKRDLIGNWSAAGDWKKSVSLLEGMTAALGSSGKLLFAKGANLLEDRSLIEFLNHHGGEITLDSRSPKAMIAEAVKIARRADVVVLALGETQGMSGEAASRTRIRIPENQQSLLKALKATGKPIVLVLSNGRPLALELENEIASAILETWFLGTQSGLAISDVLFGDYNPSGKLTASFPVNEGQIPIFYEQISTGRPPKANDPKQKYVSRYLDAPNEPLFPFGWGLSYTTFALSEPKLNKKSYRFKESIEIRLSVENTGSREGEETVQLYVRDVVASVARPVKQLRGFQKVSLRPGETREIVLKLTVEDLKFYGKDLKRIAEPGDFQILVGAHSRDLKSATFTLVR